jgi:hypothetical protein
LPILLLVLRKVEREYICKYRRHVLPSYRLNAAPNLVCALAEEQGKREQRGVGAREASRGVHRESDRSKGGAGLSWKVECRAIPQTPLRLGPLPLCLKKAQAPKLPNFVSRTRPASRNQIRNMETPKFPYFLAANIEKYSRADETNSRRLFWRSTRGYLIFERSRTTQAA